MSKLQIAVLFGGASSEHEVSRMSATTVLRAIDKSRYEVTPVGIQKGWQLVAVSRRYRPDSRRALGKLPR